MFLMLLPMEFKTCLLLHFPLFYLSLDLYRVINIELRIESLHPCSVIKLINISFRTSWWFNSLPNVLL